MDNRIFFLAPIAAAIAVLALSGCGGSDARPTQGILQTAGCAGVASISVPGVVLEKPQAVAAGTVRPGAPTNDFLPAHCVVRGVADAYVGTDQIDHGTGFELRLPDNWNGRFFFQGGGGNDGSIASAFGNPTGALATTQGTPSYPLAQGFAVVTTDGGHEGSDASGFGLDQQARVNHAYASYDRATTIAKTLIGQYYGRGPDHSYFVGCSGGGRQGMMFSQRFPTYFDGIIAQAPAMQVATGAAIDAAYETQVYSAIAPLGTDGKPVISAALSDGDLGLLANGVLAACDAADGLIDKQVSNVAACQFDPAVLQCTGAKTSSCLTSQQVTAVKTSFAGPKNSIGTPLYTSWPWDSGIADFGWRIWKLGNSSTSTSNSLFSTLIQNATAYEFLTPADPTYNLLNFNFDTGPAKLAAEDKIYGATSTDLSAFTAHGGKLMFIHGGSDPIFSANDTVAYLNQLGTAVGGADKASNFARLFIVPGMGHCSGGPATDAFDGLTAMVNWVEKGVAPDSLLAATSSTPVLSKRTRPLCPYPKYAKYNGTGDVNDAANFACTAQ